MYFCKQPLAYLYHHYMSVVRFSVFLSMVNLSATAVQHTSHLRFNFSNSVTQEILRNVWDKFRLRLDVCCAAIGNHIEHLWIESVNFIMSIIRCNFLHICHYFVIWNTRVSYSALIFAPVYQEKIWKWSEVIVLVNPGQPKLHHELHWWPKIFQGPHK